MHPFNKLREYTDMRDVVEENLDIEHQDPEAIYMAYEFLDEIEEVRKELISILIVKD